ncbi:Phosphoenolpyruvate guanylyltransferase [Sphingobium sp. AntQ-1]|uniref:2-phospho-L-lactate guanylyltransferase n=1 Tax=Sphingobium sp. AntQ-1 TaxID=2930091 RepID=UPI00234ECD14|nr:2-phospho-L-lactate guanylyltransferase [Sphingobium sp. AntQ-1]WCP15336.1 Phosphoenolpyruvate guanylyltransferase [Sphingobium sp. AntQ-1]
MQWNVIIPWKQGPDTKSRLGGVLDARQRMMLAADMARRVVGCVAEVEAVGMVRLLAPAAPLDWPCAWVRDEGRGLNRELTAARLRFGTSRFVVVHADLPKLVAGDIARLLAAAEDAGAAFAPDRHGQGTNAVALADVDPFAFAFGPNSLAGHRSQRLQAAIVETEGLGFDIDVPEDLRGISAGRILS